MFPFLSACLYLSQDGPLFFLDFPFFKLFYFSSDVKISLQISLQIFTFASIWSPFCPMFCFLSRCSCFFSLYFSIFLSRCSFSPDDSNSPQMFPDLPRWSQFSPDVPRSPQMVSVLPRCSQISPDGPSSPQMFPVLPRCS